MRIWRIIRGRVFGVFVICLAVVLVGGVYELRGQSQEHCFRGIVRDSQGSVIVGAKVTLKESSGRVLMTEYSDADGTFTLPCFKKGSYSIQIIQDGMATVEKRLRFDREVPEVTGIVLSAAALFESVNVEITAEYAALESQTATRTPTVLRDIPLSVEVVNRQLLDSRAVLTLKSALENVTAVSAAQGEGRRDQFFIRGFSAIGDQFVDGVRDDAQYYRDLSNVEQIEVIKGPGAALFGRGSSGGIINRTTKRPDLSAAFGNIEGNFGSYGHKRGMLDFGRPIVADRLALRFVGAYEDGGSFRHYFSGKRYNIAPSLEWKPTENSNIIAQFEYLDDERVPDRGIPSFRGSTLDIPIGTYFGYPESDHIRNRVLSNAIKLEHVFSNGWALRNVFRRIGSGTNYYNTYPNGICLLRPDETCSVTIDSEITSDDERLRVIRGQYNGSARQTNYFNQSELFGFVKTKQFEHKLLIGFEVGRQTKASVTFRNSVSAPATFRNPILTEPFNNGIATNDNGFSGDSFGIYFQDQLNLGSKLKALVGFRVDSFAQELNNFLADSGTLKRTDLQLSPRAGLVFQPNEFVSIYSSVSRSFQPSGENLSLATNNVELEPEFTTNYEGGMKLNAPIWRLRGTLSFFRLSRTNIKTVDPTDPSRLLSVGEQRTDGLEFTASGSPLQRIDFIFGYSLLDARIAKSNNFSGGNPIEGNLAQLTPRHSGNLWLTYRLPKSFRVGFGGYSRSHTYTSVNNLVSLPGFSRLDSSIGWRNETGFELNLIVRNLLNRKYFDTAHNDNQIMPGEPISGSVTFRYRW